MIHHPMWAGHSTAEPWIECSRCGTHLKQDFYQWVDKTGKADCDAG